MIDGLRNGFSIGYEGQREITQESSNIPFKQGVGNRMELWEKMMKETKMKRFAGPFSKEDIPFDFYIQSPVGLVPKGENQTRLIFHLSYEFDQNGSINGNTPKEKCSVKYRDLNFAVQACIRILQGADGNTIIWFSKSDLKSAFRILGIQPEDWPLLFMKVEHPITRKTLYFFDKCLPFGASISCSHFQRFSDGLRHIFQVTTKTIGQVPNYLDDFLFISLCKRRCNQLIQEFLALCMETGVPISEEKCEWATTLIIFLGILMDGINHVLAIPEDKKIRALYQLKSMISKKSSKVRELQQLAGLLNFLNHAIIPGRAFTRRMYAKFSGFAKIGFGGKPKEVSRLKAHHHVRLDKEFKQNCEMWVNFLEVEDRTLSVFRPFVDFTTDRGAICIKFFSDASAGETRGFGCYFDKCFVKGMWDKHFIRSEKPSIAYLELYALCIAVFAWTNKLINRTVIVRCNNSSAVQMVNNTTSGCKNCMYLLRHLTLRSLKVNFRIFTQYLTSQANELADALSRNQMERFFRLAPPDVNRDADPIPAELWPVSRIWMK